MASGEFPDAGNQPVGQGGPGFEDGPLDGAALAGGIGVNAEAAVGALPPQESVTATDDSSPAGAQMRGFRGPVELRQPAARHDLEPRGGAFGEAGDQPVAGAAPVDHSGDHQ